MEETTNHELTNCLVNGNCRGLRTFRCSPKREGKAGWPTWLLAISSAASTNPARAPNRVDAAEEHSLSYTSIARQQILCLQDNSPSAWQCSTTSFGGNLPSQARLRTWHTLSTPLHKLGVFEISISSTLFFTGRHSMAKKQLRNRFLRYFNYQQARFWIEPQPVVF